MRYLLVLLLLSCMAPTQNLKGLETATFAGGCFWCVEHDFEQLHGVVEVLSGYTGGETVDPNYASVSSGTTGHVEAVRVYYDPEKIRYEELLDAYWRMIDPTDDGGQFVDRGSSYRSAIFYENEEQKQLAEASKEKISAHFDKPIVTQVKPFHKFYRAEDYHQDFAEKSTLRYTFYRRGSGRDQFLEEQWGNEEAFKQVSSKLTPLQYRVMKENGTEPPFDNAYWDHEREGIYVDRLSGEVLFSSKDKFKSGTGWPSFTQPLEPDNIVEQEDKSLFTTRTEVRSKQGDNHLGHVFSDGPEPTGLRYCINSAALRFIPKEDLEKEGYGEYRNLF